MISLENIKHFIAVVEHNGINRAAEHIFISSSSLSRSIQIIEEDVKKLLFDRVGRTLHLNADGKCFYEDAKKLILQYENLLSVNQVERKKELTGHYMIGASHFLCKSIVAHKVDALAKKNPKASFGVYSFDSSVLIKKIHLGEIDIGFSFSLKPSSVIKTQKIYTGEMYLCTGRKHPLSKAPFSEVKKNLSNYPAIMHRPSDSIERCDNHPVFKEHNIKLNIPIYWDSDFFALEVLAQNQSWSLMPDFVIDSDPRVIKLSHPKNWSAPYDVMLFWNVHKSLDELREALAEID